MENQIPEDVIKDRFDRLLTVVNEISKEKTALLEGTTQEVLIEEENKKIDGYVSGRLSNNSVVHFKGNKKRYWKTCKCLLKRSKRILLYGRNGEIMSLPQMMQDVYENHFDDLTPMMKNYLETKKQHD